MEAAGACLESGWKGQEAVGGRQELGWECLMEAEEWRKLPFAAESLP